jgi:hypothetical protein
MTSVRRVDSDERYGSLLYVTCIRTRLSSSPFRSSFALKVDDISQKVSSLGS